VAKLKDVDVFSSGAISPNPGLRPDKDFVRTCVENEPTVRDVRAIKLLVRGVRAIDDARGFVGISFANGVFSLGRRVLLCGFLGSDWPRHRGATLTLRSRRWNCVRLVSAGRWFCILTSGSLLAHHRVGEN